MPNHRPGMLEGVAPALFVVLWSTGFIGAKLGLPYAGSNSFLALRFLVVLALLLPLAAWMRAPWPKSAAAWGHLAVVGGLLHAGYLGGVFAAIKAGMSAGMVALIVGMQPLLTAALAGRMLGEQVGARQWLGFVLGFGGVALVLSGRIGSVEASPAALALAVLALVSITLGTLYQKRHCTGMNLWSGSAVQFMAALAILGTLSLALESGETIVWRGEFVFALGWLVLVLSIGAISLLHVLIRGGAATRVAALFYLTPPTTALIAWAMFGERLDAVAVFGMGLAALGVALATRVAR